MRLSERRLFILLKFLHFADNEVYRGQVSPKFYNVKPVFDHLLGTFSASHVPENQLSIDESLLLWKGRLGWKVYIPKKRSRFDMESFKLCEAKTGYIWNMWYTGSETELKSEIHGIDISHYSKLSKIVLTLAEQLLTRCLDNYYSSPELFDLLNQLYTDAVVTVRSNRKELPKDVMKCKLKKGDVAVSYRNKLMALKWKDKRDVCMLSSIHEMKSEGQEGWIQTKSQSVH
jgi:hypothetical protein